MKEIHKTAAVVIKDNKFLMVKKKGMDILTSLGGRPERGESEEQTLMREIREEICCHGEIIKKLGDFKAKAAHDETMVKLSAYLVKLHGKIKLDDPELEEYMFVPQNYREIGIKLPTSIEEQIIPFCIKEGLLKW